MRQADRGRQSCCVTTLQGNTDGLPNVQRDSADAVTVL